MTKIHTQKKINSVATPGVAFFQEVDRITAKKIIAQKPIVILDFAASWCRPCLNLREMLREQLLPSLSPEVAIISVDVDNDSDYADEMGIRAMPTLFFFHHGQLIPFLVNDREEKCILGAKPTLPLILKEMIAKCLAKDQLSQ